MENEIKKKTNKITPKKPKKIIRKKRKITTENFPSGVGKRPRLLRHSKSYKKKSETSEVKIPKIKQVKVFTEEERKLRSEKSKQYWENLKKNDPQKYAERISKLHSNRRIKYDDKQDIKEEVKKDQKSDARSRAMKEYWDKLKAENPEEFDRRISKLKGIKDEHPTEPTLEIKGDYFYDDSQQQEIEDFEKIREGFLEGNTAIPQREFNFIYEDTVEYYYFQQAYDHPDREGSMYILSWIKEMKAEFKDVKFAQLIQYAQDNMIYFQSWYTYKSERAQDFVISMMKMWKDRNLIGDVFSEEEYDKFREITLKKINEMMNVDEEVDYYE